MLREPCVHGRYEAHAFYPEGCSVDVCSPSECPGGRTLTDADLAERGWVRLWGACGTCDGHGRVLHRWMDAEGERRVEDSCPACAGTGRTLRDGVEGVVRMGGMSGALYPSSVMGDQPDGLVVPVSMLKGGECE